MTRELRTATLVAWALAAVVLCLVAIPRIVHLWFADPDDAMRLLEVRDWLGGQSWWDVSQHRLVGATGTGTFAMHWSRIVDLPIAALIALFDPLVGADAATRIAVVAVPLAILLAIMALVATLTAALAGVERAKLAVLLVPLAPPIVYQAGPGRIDHHGWQIMLALAAVAALLGPPTRRNGALAGAALAALVSVSLEGMPITAAILGVALLAWAYDPTRRAQVSAMTGALFGGVVLIHVAQRGPAMFAPACDAIAPAWIGALGIACAGIGATLAFARTPVRRVAGIVAAGIAGAATLRLVAPVCTRGPFATLDPLVYQVWYSNVSEGLPAWVQTPTAIVMLYALPVVGLLGVVVAWRASKGEARMRWAMMAAIVGAALAFSLFVARGVSTANAVAVPGAAWLLHGWLTRARAIRPVLPRTGATALALLAAAPGSIGVVMPGDAAQAKAKRPPAKGVAARVCDRRREIADLVQLPPGLVFAPLDVSPELLVQTRHRAIAGGYHRNADAMHVVLATFMGSPAAARAAVLRSGADYVAGCPGENETQTYRDRAPDGFWARLERGERFDWLEPVPVRDSPVLAWRVVRPAR